MTHPVLNTLIYTNLFVAFGATSLVWTTLALAHLTCSWDEVSTLLMSATLLVYTLDRTLKASPEDTQTQRHFWLRAHKRTTTSITLCALISLASITFWLPLKLIALLVPMSILTLAYSLPLVPFKGKRVRLKDIPGLKVFLISVIWSMATTSIPLMFHEQTLWSPKAIALGVERALFIFAITLPFDVRDMMADARVHIKTLPTTLGITRTRHIALVSITLWTMLAASIHESTHTMPIILTGLVIAGLLSQLHATQPEHYYTVFMDGTMLLYSALIFGNIKLASVW